MQRDSYASEFRVTGTLTDEVGFEHPTRQEYLAPRRHAASLELIASLALAVSTVVAATAVSIGIAHADTLLTDATADSSFAFAALFGVVLAGWEWLTVRVTRSVPRGN